MRTAMFWLPTAALCCGLQCIPIGQTDGENSNLTGGSGDQSTVNGESDPSDTQIDGAGAGCHSGTFECSEGPEWSVCGTWQFDVSEADSFVGTGTITLPGDSTPIQLTLSGAADPTAIEQEIALAGAFGEGSGTMHAGNVGPTLEITGDWAFSVGPDAEGDEIVGQIKGISCQSLE